MAVNLTAGQRAFIRRLTAQTGLNSRVLAAQVFTEMNGGAAAKREREGYYNWLNIGHTDSGEIGLTKDRTWRDPIKAADATADFLKGKKYGASEGIRNILKSANASPDEQIRAIGRSGWATNPNYESTIRSVWKNAPALGASGSRSSDGGQRQQEPQNATEQTTTTVTGAGFDPGPGASALAQLAQQQARPQAPTSMPSPPQFSAAAPMPTGYQAPSAAPIEQPQSNLTQLLANVSSSGGSIPQVDVKTSSKAASKQADLASGVQGGPTKSPGPGAAVDYARSKIGTKEVGGNNRGRLPDYLNERFGFGRQGGEPWCAMFTSVAVTKGGAPASARTASVAEVRRKAQSGQGYKGFVDPRKAKSGDLILFGNDHIGMVERVDRKGIVMIAGNDSDGVQRRRVPLNAGDVVRPKYGAR